MNLKQKIIIGYGAASVILALVIAWAIANLVSLGQASEAILSENYRSILAAENMVDAIERQDSATLMMLIDRHSNAKKQWQKNDAVFIEWLGRAKDNVTIQGEDTLIKEIDDAYAKYREFLFNWKPLETEQSSYSKNIYPLFESVRDACIELRQLNEDTMYAASIEAESVAKRAIWSTLIIALIALLITLIFSIFLAERIVRPLRAFMTASRKISSGEYSVEVPVETTDEIGELAKEFNEMAKKLLHFHELNVEQIIAEKNRGSSILCSIEDGLIEFNHHLIITGINPAACRFLRRNEEEIMGASSDQIFEQGKVCEMLQQTLKEGRPPKIPDEQRILILKEDEKYKHYLFSISIIRGHDSQVVGILLLLRDVTRLREVEQLKSEFVMAASHELRTPLTGLGMSVDLLIERTKDSLNEKDQELLEAAHEEVNRMKSLVNDLLDLSKIEAGRIDMEYENVEVSRLFQYAEKVFKNQLEMQHVNLSLVLPKDIPDVRADANKITWVISNLISNALRYVDAEGEIKLRANSSNTFVYISVEDNGIGIPESYQSKIFEKFMQVEGQVSGGTGLGLAICKEIVKAHGGTIWVESTVDEGTTFTFTLPILPQ